MGLFFFAAALERNKKENDSQHEKRERTNRRSLVMNYKPNPNPNVISINDNELWTNIDAHTNHLYNCELRGVFARMYGNGKFEICL